MKKRKKRSNIVVGVAAENINEGDLVSCVRAGFVKVKPGLVQTYCIADQSRLINIVPRDDQTYEITFHILDWKVSHLDYLRDTCRYGKLYFKS